MPSLTLRWLTVLSGLTMKTNVPAAPRWIAATGTTVWFGSVSTRRRIFTNWLGNSLPSVLSNMARSLTVPVVGSTTLSTVASLPLAIWVVWLRSQASTSRTAPWDTRPMTWEILSYGTVKTTDMGDISVTTTTPAA